MRAIAVLVAMCLVSTAACTLALPTTAEVPLACPQFDPAGLPISAPSLDPLMEVAGLIASRSRPGVLWLHNNRDDITKPGVAKLYAFDSEETAADKSPLVGYPLDFEVKATLALEDATVVPRDGQPDHLYIGDIGGDTNPRTKFRILRVDEPDVSFDTAGTLETLPTTEIHFHYPDNEDIRSRAMFADPETGDIFLFSHNQEGEATEMFMLSASSIEQELDAEAELLREFDFGEGVLPNETTSATIAPGGRAIVVKTKTHIRTWARQADQTIAEALEEEACWSFQFNSSQALDFGVHGGGVFAVSLTAPHAITGHPRVQ